MKLWKGNKNKARLEISLYGKTNSIHVGKDVIRVLGVPEYLCFMINQAMDSIVIRSGSYDEFLAFKVPDNICFLKNKQMRVASQAFVNGLMLMNDLDPSHTYQIEGSYSEEKNVVVFYLKDSQLFEGQIHDDVVAV